MSSALIAVKDILIKNGLGENNIPDKQAQNRKGKERDKQTTASGKVLDSESETTIYHNTLNQLGDNTVVVDSKSILKLLNPRWGRCQSRKVTIKEIVCHLKIGLT